MSIPFKIFLLYFYPFYSIILLAIKNYPFYSIIELAIKNKLPFILSNTEVFTYKQTKQIYLFSLSFEPPLSFEASVESPLHICLCKEKCEL